MKALSRTASRLPVNLRCSFLTTLSKTDVRSVPDSNEFREADRSQGQRQVFLDNLPEQYFVGKGE